MLKGLIIIGGAFKGTRFRPLSLERPKPLFPIAGFPTLQHHVENLANVPGLREILIIGFYPPSDIAPFVNDLLKELSHVNIRYLQEFAPLGTAGGIHHFRDLILMGDPEAIFVINADVCGDVPLEEMAEFRRKKLPEASCLILTTEATREQSLNYGCIVVTPTGLPTVAHYVEKPATYISHNINCGIYLITPKLFPRLAQVFADKANNHARLRYGNGAAIYANRHCLNLYKKVHPERLLGRTEEGPTIIGDVYAHPSARIHPSATVSDPFPAHPTPIHPERLLGRTEEGPTIIGDVYAHPSARIHPSATVSDPFPTHPTPIHPERLLGRTEEGPTIIGDVYAHPSARIHPSATVSDPFPAHPTPIHPERLLGRTKEGPTIIGDVYAHPSARIHPSATVSDPFPAHPTPIHPERLLGRTEEGPTIIGDVYAHPSARIHPSATIGPNVSIGKDAVIGHGVRIRESIILEGATVMEHACVLYSIIDRESVVGAWSRVEGTPTGPNPNMPFAKLESKSLFLPDGRLNPAITILGRNVSVPAEAIILNSIVLPHKDLTASYKNQIIL